MEVQTINTVLTTLNLLIHITMILFGIGLLVQKKVKIPYFQEAKKFLTGNAIKLSFIVVLVAMLSSLFYSEIAGYEPCVLCIWQRIFIYPQVLLLGLALYRKEKSIIPYSLLLAFVSSMISLYHYVIQRVTEFSTTINFATPCTIDGACTSKFVFGFGYITVPMMALTTGLTVLFLMWLAKNRGHLSKV